jgi:hypothetical protein
VDSLTRDAPFAGTIDYIAPEQARGEEIDGRTDIYSLGCVLFECLSGAPPYRRSSELAAVLAHLNEPPPALGEIRPELAPLDPVVARALAKEPEDRPATAGALMADARAAIGGVGAGEAAPAARVAQLRTFLITDVRGYTKYTQEHGDEAAAKLAADFARLVRDVVSPRDGRLLELRGDEALVVFESARRALQAAVELQTRAPGGASPRDRRRAGRRRGRPRRARLPGSGAQHGRTPLRARPPRRNSCHRGRRPPGGRREGGRLRPATS